MNKEIAVGMPATLCVGSDRYAVDIVELIPYKKGYSQKWGTTIKHAVTKRRTSGRLDKWNIKTNEEVGFYGDQPNSTLYLRIGDATEYIDPHF